MKTALEEALTRILTPKRQIDILREVAAIKGTRPYTITFCGVNGVGKSTNLAKVTSWLMQNGLTVRCILWGVLTLNRLCLLRVIHSELEQ